MRTILQLCYAHFSPSRWTALGGLIVCVALTINPEVAVAHQLMILLAISAWGAILLSTVAMTAVSDRLIRGRLANTTSQGRLQVMVSAMITTLLVAFPAALLVHALWFRVTPEVGSTALSSWQFLLRAYTGTVWLTMLAHLWILLGRSVGRPGKGLRLCILLGTTLSSPFIFRALTNPTTTNWPLWLIVGIWAALTLVACYWPIWRTLGVSRSSGPLGAMIRSILQPARATPSRGQQIQAALGLRGSWVALGMLIAMVVMTVVLAGRGRPIQLLLYFSSCVAFLLAQDVAIATMRSRTLWLRMSESREALFARIERMLWRRLAPRLVLFMGLFGLLAFLISATTSQLAVGLVLNVLMFCLGMYGFLPATRGSNAFDTTVGMGLMVLMFLVALFASQQQAINVYLGCLGVAIGFLVINLRAWAKNRWAHLDWSVCRPKRAV